MIIVEKMSESQENSATVEIHVDEDQNNKNNIVCERCSSVILLLHKAKYVKKEFYLPFMKQKCEASKPCDGETVEDFWVVDDMFTFENVGFSNTIDCIKYLICADCEIGPIGFHDTQDKNAFYIAHSRIKYDG